MKHFIIGCSYIRDAYEFGIIKKYFGNNTKVVGQDGCGNDFISHRILQELRYQHENYFIMFTGINRTSIQVPWNDKNHDNLYDGYPYRCPVGNVLHVFSGGDNTVPKNKKGNPIPLSETFKNRSMENSNSFYNDYNLYHIFNCVSTLHSRNIKFKYTFIYNGDNEHEYSLGKIDKTNWFYKNLNKQNMIAQTPYEFCVRENLLQDDGFHPSKQGWDQYFQSIDI